MNQNLQYTPVISKNPKIKSAIVKEEASIRDLEAMGQRLRTEGLIGNHIIIPQQEHLILINMYTLFNLSTLLLR